MDCKHHPVPEWVDALRVRFPLDREMDAVLARKLRLRPGPAYEPVSQARLVEGLRALIEHAEGEPVTIEQPHWLAGGASKIQLAFRLGGSDGRRCVLRMEPAASVVETSRRQEFELLSAIEGVVPAPQALWLDADARFLPYPALVYSFVEGVTKPPDVAANVSNLGIDFGTRHRPALAPQFIECLARIHTWDWRAAALPSFERPESPDAAIVWQLNKWERVWHEDCCEEIPLIRYAARWLRDHRPVPDRISIIHGDYRGGNFLFDPETDRITGLLDWELAHLGDRHEELALISLATLGHYAEDGHTYLVGGMLPEAEFFTAYERASGLPINRAVFDYYRIFNAYRVAVNLIASAFRVASAGKTHQDVLLGWIMGLGYAVLADLQQLLEET